MGEQVTPRQSNPGVETVALNATLVVCGRPQNKYFTNEKESHLRVIPYRPSLPLR